MHHVGPEPGGVTAVNHSLRLFAASILVVIVLGFVIFGPDVDTGPRSGEPLDS